MVAMLNSPLIKVLFLGAAVFLAGCVSTNGSRPVNKTMLCKATWIWLVAMFSRVSLKRR